MLLSAMIDGDLSLNSMPLILAKLPAINYGQLIWQPLWPLFGKIDLGKNDFGKTDFGKNDFGRTDFGKNDFGNTNFGEKRILGKKLWFPQLILSIVFAFFPNSVFANLFFGQPWFSKIIFFYICFCKNDFWPNFSFKIPFVARHNCHMHTADSNQSNFHFFFFSLATAYM